jgi:hypothetical protein
MTPTTTLRVRVLLILVLLILPAGFMLVDSLNYPSAKARAARWARQLDDREVAVLVAAIPETLPIVYRRALYAELSPANRSQFWLRRIKAYVSEHKALSKSALSSLDEVTRFIEEKGPELFSRLANASDGARLADLGKATIHQLGREDAVALLMRVGPPDTDPSVSEPLNMRDRVARWLNSTFSVDASVGDCECNKADDWCGTGLQCFTANCDPSELVCEGGNCEWVPGCGFLFLYECDGACFVA